MRIVCIKAANIAKSWELKPSPLFLKRCSHFYRIVPSKQHRFYHNSRVSTMPYEVVGGTGRTFHDASVSRRGTKRRSLGKENDLGEKKTGGEAVCRVVTMLMVREKR